MFIISFTFFLIIMVSTFWTCLIIKEQLFGRATVIYLLASYDVTQPRPVMEFEYSHPVNTTKFSRPVGDFITWVPMYLNL